MTDVKQSIAAKFLGAFVAIAMVFSFVAPAQAQTTQELQQMINDLLSQIQQLEAQIGGGSSASVCPYTWTRSLSQGDTGADVKRLQEFLNSNPDHRVAAAGQVGSAGMETEYYGPATAGAVTKFQQMYSAEVLAPVGLASGTGYFGPSTRAKMNSLCDEGGTTGGGTTGGGSDVELSGIGTLDTFEVDDVSNNDVQEGESDVAVAEFEVEFQNGDARIDFMDIELLQSGANPWEAFENISLWVDGEKIAEADASSESDYLGDEDDGIIRVSGLDIVGMEDEPVTITLAVTTFNNLDSDEIGTWNVQVENVRYFDAAGVATTDNGTDGIASETATFDTEEAGQDEELAIRTNGNDPDATTFVVDASTDTNDLEIFSFDVEAEEGDLDLERAVVKVTTSGASTTDVVRDAYLTIGGMTFKAENVDSTAGAVTAVTDSKSIKSTGDDVWYVFDIDKDITLDEDDRTEAVLSVDLKPADGTNYSSGQTIQASVDSATGDEWKAEGGDDLVAADFTGSATGDSHLLQTAGLAIDFVSSTEEFRENSDATTTDNQGIYTMVVEVTAFETDVWIDKTAATGTTATTSGAMYRFLDSSNVVATTDSISSTLTSSASTEGGQFVVRDGSTETFTLKVTADPTSSGDFRVALYGINYESNDSTEDTSETQQRALPTEDFESDFLNI